MASRAITNYRTYLVFGDREDRVIETVGTTNDQRFFELGYYNGVEKPKAIINISPAVGCPVGCNFCELTNPGRALTSEEMVSQIFVMTSLAQDIDNLDLNRQQLKINIAKTGDPIFNGAVIEALEKTVSYFPSASFKYSTSMPDTRFLTERIRDLAVFARDHKNGSTQLQISLISTNEKYRRESAKAKLASLISIRQAVDTWHSINPLGRTPNCSLIIGENTPCNPLDVINVLPPNLIRFRIRKIVSTEHSKRSEIHEASEERICEIVRQFRDAGYSINTAGIPTRTETIHGLASNVTRHRLEGGAQPEGVLFVPHDPNAEPVLYPNSFDIIEKLRTLPNNLAFG